LAEREEILKALAVGDAIQSIAKRLSRASSTICREIKRDSGAEGCRASHADALARDRAKRRYART
jgi:IS30 family transposase